VRLKNPYADLEPEVFWPITKKWPKGAWILFLRHSMVMKALQSILWMDAKARTFF